MLRILIENIIVNLPQLDIIKIVICYNDVIYKLALIYYCCDDCIIFE